MNISKNIIDKSKNFIKQNYFLLFVIGIVIFAFILRYWHTKLGLPYIYNVDEDQIPSVDDDDIATDLDA